jgi:NOL1/NOP2/fmu family ribosome biogenesis protein
MLERCKDKDRDLVVGYLGERFGLDPSLFLGHSFYDGGKGRIYLGPSASHIIRSTIAAGLTIARISPGDPPNVKPTTNLIQLMGIHATRNRIDLQKEKAKEFASGLDLQLPEGSHPDCSDGFIVVRYEGMSLGCGQLHGALLRNLIPKAKRLRLDHL